MTLLEAVKAAPRLERVAFLNQHLEELQLEANRELSDLDRIGTLLCHASPKASRDESPIIGDFLETEQSKFETEVYGDPSDPKAEGTYGQLDDILASEDSDD